MAIKLVRKPYKIGASRGLIIPGAWVNYYGERAEKLTIFGSTLLIIAPKGLEGLAEKIVQDMEQIPV